MFDTSHLYEILVLVLGGVSFILFNIFFAFYLYAKKRNKLDPQKSFLENLWDSPAL